MKELVAEMLEIAMAIGFGIVIAIGVAIGLGIAVVVNGIVDQMMEMILL